MGAVRLDDDALAELLDGLGVGLDLNFVAPRIEPLLDALIRDAPKAVLERTAADAAESVWSGELRSELAEELWEFREQVLDEDAELVPTIDATLSELERPPRRNRVVHALVWRAALELVTCANRNYKRMAELEEELAGAPPAAHRSLTVRVAEDAVLAADVGGEEAAEAIARFVVGLPPNSEAAPKQLDRATARLARSLATDERRRTARASLATLAHNSAGEFPLASGALERLLAEPIPEDPAKDDLWVSLVIGLAREQLARAFVGDELA